MVYANTYYTSLRFVNTKCGNFHLFIVHGWSFTKINISDQEDEDIWKILAMERFKMF